MEVPNGGVSPSAVRGSSCSYRPLGAWATFGHKRKTLRFHPPSEPPAICLRKGDGGGALFSGERVDSFWEYCLPLCDQRHAGLGDDPSCSVCACRRSLRKMRQEAGDFPEVQTTSYDIALGMQCWVTAMAAMS